MHNALLVPAVESDAFSSPVLTDGFSFASDELVQGLPVEEVHRRALAARNALGGAQRSLCFWLLEVDARRLFEEFGCSSTFHYAEVYLQLSPHTISEMLRTAREVERFPLFAKALAKGQVSTSKIREISRVAVESTERYWLEAARKHTQREIEKMVAFTPKGGLPPKGRENAGNPGKEGRTGGRETGITGKESQGDSRPGSIIEAAATATPGAAATTAPEDAATPGMSVTPAVSGKAHETGAAEGSSAASETGTGIKYHDRLVLELSGEQMAVVKDAFDRARRESGLKDRASLLEHIARAYLAGSPDRIPETKGSKPPYQIVLHNHPATGLTWCESVNGERYVDSSTIEKALCDAEIIDTGNENAFLIIDTEVHELNKDHGKDDTSMARVSPTVGFLETCPGENCREENRSGEHSLMAYVNSLYVQYKGRGKSGCKRHNHTDKSGEEKHCHGGHQPSRHQTVTTIPRPLRRKIMLRDQCTCQNPGCGSNSFIVLHHIVPLGAGGENAEFNIIVLCSKCHDLVHRGKLTVSGHAPHGLTWGRGR